MDVVLHLGAHKTASTHLQQTLRAARPALSGAGVALFTPVDLRGPRVLPLEAAAAGDAGAGAELRAALAGAAAAPRPAGGGVRRLVISEENLLGPALRTEAPGVLYPLAARRLGAVLGATGLAPVRVMLAVRAPADWLVSAHAQRMLAGHWQDFAEFAAGHDPRRLAWAELVARLLSVPGVAGCDVWTLADWPSVLPAVLGRMLPDGVAVATGAGAGTGPSNPGLSARALAMLAALDPAPADRDARRAAAAAARARFPKGAAHPPPDPFGPALRAEAAAAHAADLARLAALPGVRRLVPAR